MEDLSYVRLDYDARNDATWVKLPARHVLHGVTEVRGTRVSMSYYVPSFLNSLDVSIAYTLGQLGLPVRECVKQHPDSVYVPMNQECESATKAFPVIEIQEASGVSDSVLASKALFDEPQAMAVQELQVPPRDVAAHFSELAKAHPISMKAVRNTMNEEKEGEHEEGL
eukprot:6024341-Amphidinium_carterae.1